MGEILLVWDMPSHPGYERGWLWYTIAGAIGTTLIVYSVASGNYLFAIIILILAIVIALTSLRAPEPLRIALSETGCGIGRQFYPYREVAKFSIVYEPPVVQNLYLDFKSGLRPRLTIDLTDQNPLEVRELIGTHVREDIENTDESLSEYLGRLLKI